MKKEVEKPALQLAFDKMRRYCAYQERCHYDINRKIFSLNLTEDQRAEIISKLIDENFLNEERFAFCFARSKHNQKNWGKLKIRAELNLRKIPKKLIERALLDVSDDVYLSNFHKLAKTKLKEIGKLNTQAKRAKFYNYLKNKGYESELIYSYIE